MPPNPPPTRLGGHLLKAFGSTPHDWLNTSLLLYILGICLPHLGFT